MTALDRIAEHCSDNLDSGTSEDAVRDAEQTLGITFPPAFREYLLKYNYAELHGDPLYGTGQKRRNAALIPHPTDRECETEPRGRAKRHGCADGAARCPWR